jgi:hypothetical protein
MWQIFTTLLHANTNYRNTSDDIHVHATLTLMNLKNTHNGTLARAVQLSKIS